MEYIWGNSSHETTWQPQDIMLTYTDCPFDHSLNIPHDCINDLVTCGLFQPGGPSWSPRSLICAVCHYPSSLHRTIMSTPLHHTLVRSAPCPYYPFLLAPQPDYPAHGGESSTRLEPEMTQLPLPSPRRASQPGPAERQPVRKLTPERSERLKQIARKHNYCPLKEYTKGEAQQICAELQIKKKCLSDWISRYNIKRKRAAIKQAAREAAAQEEAPREAAAQEEAAGEPAAQEEAAGEPAAQEEADREPAAQEEAARQEAANEEAAT